MNVKVRSCKGMEKVVNINRSVNTFEILKFPAGAGFNTLQCTNLSESRSITLQYFQHVKSIFKKFNLYDNMLWNFTQNFKQSHSQKLQFITKSIDNHYNQNVDLPTTTQEYTNYPCNNSLANWLRPAKIPDIKNIKSLQPNIKNLEQVLIKKKLAYGQYSLWDYNKLKILVEFTRSIWSKDWCNNFTKNVLNSLILGFKDDINEKKFLELIKESKPEYTIANDKIIKFIEGEIEQFRLVEIPRYKGSLNAKSFKAISAKIIHIEEQKEIMTENGKVSKYNKDRFVFNNVTANRCLTWPKFIMPNLELIFKHTKLLNKLKASRTISIYDRSNYYRQWNNDLDSCRLALVKVVGNKYGSKSFLDCAGRMGSSTSAFKAQALSDVTDHIFNSQGLDLNKNMKEENREWSITLQDDTLIFNSTDQTHDRFCKLSENMGLKLNTLKSQVQVSTGCWSEYNIDLDDKTSV